MNRTDDPGEDVEMNTNLLKDHEKEPPRGTLAAAAQTPKGIRKQVIDAGCIGLNIISSVTLVFLNKW